MISHATLLANDSLCLIMEQEQTISYEIDSIKPKRQELEEMKKKLIEQIDEKRHNLKLLKIYIDKLGSINDWCLRGKEMLSMQTIDLSNNKANRSLFELEHFLTDLSSMNIEELKNTSTPEPLHSMIIQVFNRVNDVRDLCEKRCEQLRYFIKPNQRPVQHVYQFEQNQTLNLIDETKTNFLEKIDKKQRQVATELLVTEQVYVEELRIIIQSYMIKFDDPEYNRYLPSIILEKKCEIFSNLPEIYEFHAMSFLRDLQFINDNNKTNSIGSAIAACFIKRKSNFKLYEQYVLNKQQSERLWKEYCCGNSFFIKIQQSLGHRLPLDSYLLKPIQRITQYQLFLKEMVKNTRHEQERLDLEEALCVMLNTLSYLNDMMHSTQIVGYTENLNTLGKIRLRNENCLISKEKRRGTVYTRTKTSTRDIFLFQSVILLCKKKFENCGKTFQYQFKEIIQINDIIVCTNPKNDRKKFEIVLKDYSYIIQFLSNGKISEEMSSRWIETIKNCLTQQIEQRRAVIKHRSSSLDFSLRSNRRRSQNRPAATNRSPESDDEQFHSPKNATENNKTLINNNSILHL